MAKSKTFLATMPDGQVAKRTSRTRTYEYMVAIRLSYKEALMSAKQLRDTDISNFQYCRRESDAATAKYNPSKASWRVGETDEEYFAKNATEIEDCKTGADYQRKLIKKRIAEVEKAKAAGYYDKWGSAGWCGRLDLAQKLAAKEQNSWPVEEAAICTAILQN